MGPITIERDYYAQASLILVFVVVSFVPAFSQDTDKTYEESWYTYWGLGSASITYPAQLQKVIDILNQKENASRTTLSLDMLGFYWPLAPRTIGGVIINGAADRILINKEWIQINQYIYGASVVHYLGDSFGSGLFVRADAGIARLVSQASNGSSTSSETGFGFLFGGGFSFDLDGTRLLLNLNYSSRKVENEIYKSIGFSMGALF